MGLPMLYYQMMDDIPIGANTKVKLKSMKRFVVFYALFYYFPSIPYQLHIGNESQQIYAKI